MIHVILWTGFFTWMRTVYGKPNSFSGASHHKSVPLRINAEEKSPRARRGNACGNSLLVHQRTIYTLQQMLGRRPFEIISYKWQHRWDGQLIFPAPRLLGTFLRATPLCLPSHPRFHLAGSSRQSALNPMADHISNPWSRSVVEWSTGNARKTAELEQLEFMN